MSKHRAKLQILVAAYACLFLVGTTALNSHAAVPPNQLMITFGSLSERETALFVARDYGMFAKHGLDVKLVHVRNGAVALSALASGDAQFYLGAATGSTLGAIAGGLDAVFVTSLIHKLEGTFVVRHQISSRVTRQNRRCHKPRRRRLDALHADLRALGLGAAEGQNKSASGGG
jgi:ABC-type nitrate/sulfonate/bicarbonate transport system substrate-binding protein